MGGASWSYPGMQACSCTFMLPDPCSLAGRAKALVRTRVEPKTFFANERTFLQWLQIRWDGGEGVLRLVQGWLARHL